jgi:small subunit ribosomal protein S4
MGTNLFSASKYDRLLTRKPHPPGDNRPRRRKMSDYGLQLREKQKLRYAYGLHERQLRRIYRQARRQGTATGEKIAELLERRLDNAVFRLGMAVTRAQARQLVNHGHITVNGSRCTIPSRLLDTGDSIKARNTTGTLSLVRNNLSRNHERPRWMSWDGDALEGRVTDAPRADDMNLPVELQRVVEFYAR